MVNSAFRMTTQTLKRFADLSNTVALNAGILWLITRHGDRDISPSATTGDERRWSGTTYRQPSPTSRRTSICAFGESRPSMRRSSVFEGINVCRSQISAIDLPDSEYRTFTLGRFDTERSAKDLETPQEEKEPVEMEECLPAASVMVATPPRVHHW